MTEQNKKIYPRGMKFYPPRDNAPAFVKGRFWVKAPEFVTFIEDHRNVDGFVSFDLLEGRDGLYAVLNTFEPKKREGVEAAAKTSEYPAEDIDPNDIPF